MKFNNLVAKAGTLLLLLFFFLQGQVKAQQVRYTCFKKSVCIKSPVRLKKYSLSNRDTTFRSNDSGVCYVTRLGTYFLLSSEIDTGVEPPKIEFTSFGNFQDTVQSWAMYSVLAQGYADDFETGDWIYCDNKCDGYKADYYRNGQKRVEGTFKKGKPVNYVKWYDSTGKAITVEHYKDGKKIRSVQLN